MKITASRDYELPRGTPCNGLYGKALRGRGIIFKYVSYMVGISLAEVYERVRKSVTSSLEGPSIKIFRTDQPYGCIISFRISSY